MYTQTVTLESSVHADVVANSPIAVSAADDVSMVLMVNVFVSVVSTLMVAVSDSTGVMRFHMDMDAA